MYDSVYRCGETAVGLEECMYDSVYRCGETAVGMYVCMTVCTGVGKQL